MESNKFNELGKLFLEEKINKNSIRENQVLSAYMGILESMSTDFLDYRENYSILVSLLEINEKQSLKYSLTIFSNLFEKVLLPKSYNSFDRSIFEEPFNQFSMDKIMMIMESSYQNNNHRRLSEEVFDLTSLNHSDKKCAAAVLVREIQEISSKHKWSKDNIDTSLMMLGILRHLLKSLNNIDVFYSTCGLLIDGMANSQYYQAARDISEEILIAAFKDGVPEWGFFNSFRINSIVGNVNASLVYINLSLVSMLKKTNPFSERYIFEIIWQEIKFFRNINLYYLALHIYDIIPKELKISSYDRRSIDQTYFTVLLKMRSPMLPSIVFDYLNKIREEVLSNAKFEALQWLVFLYNLRIVYPTVDLEELGIISYVKIFESIVPIQKVEKYKNIIYGDSDNLKKYLLESILKLQETRNRIDFIYDNDFAITISNRLILQSTSNKNISSFLLAMALKSDFSILFLEKDAKDVAPLIIPEFDINKLGSIYDDNKAIISKLTQDRQVAIVWLGYAEGQVFLLKASNNDYVIEKLIKWDQKQFQKLIDDDYFHSFSFSEFQNDSSGVFPISIEEFKDDEKSIANDLSFAQIIDEQNLKEIFIVKDMEISAFPQNLFLTLNGEFISKKIPITNILSTEWLLNRLEKNEELIPNYTKSIWIPIESNDIALNILYNNIEDTLLDNKFAIYKSTKLSQVISSDLNIVCSHGTKSIAEDQIIFQENKPSFELHNNFRKGKVLIYFVCHSGSMKLELFKNNVTSLVKNAILNGYETVIAPFWALEVTIPKYWLPAFLNSIELGHTISKSVFNANQEVYRMFPTPAAWACLHIYGNPNIKIINSS